MGIVSLKTGNPGTVANTFLGSIMRIKPVVLHMPQGFGSLFFTQLFSTMSFAVLYATLVLYMEGALHFSAHEANLVAGVYLAYNFSLHLLSGYVGGRFFSYRGLVVTGIIFQLFACLLLAYATVQSFYWGMACMLVGTGTIVTCLNMLLSQLFAPEDIERRQTGFLWNYGSMNVGFMLGFSLAGYFQLHADYHSLFLLTAVNNVIALIVLVSRWKYMADRVSIYAKASAKGKVLRMSFGLITVFLLVPALHALLNHTVFSGRLVLLVGVLVAVLLLVLVYQRKSGERRKFLAFFILLLSAQIFWISYQLAPMCLTLFAKNNVNLHVLGFLIAPGWIQNINSICIVIGAPLVGILLGYLRRRLRFPLLGLQYSAGLLISAAAMFILPIGVALATDGYTAFIWLFFTYVFQAIAELLISPIGCAMVGQLIPERWQSICMGSVLLNTGVASVLSSYFSNSALGTSGSNNPLVTNPSYVHAFNQLGIMTLVIGLLLLLLTPWLNRLMREDVF